MLPHAKRRSKARHLRGSAPRWADAPMRPRPTKTIVNAVRPNVATGVGPNESAAVDRGAPHGGGGRHPNRAPPLPVGVLEPVRELQPERCAARPEAWNVV